MKRRILEKHLRDSGCVLNHHGGSHDDWIRPATGKHATIPRHTEIKIGTAKAICKALGVPPPPARA